MIIDQIYQLCQLLIQMSLFNQRNMKIVIQLIQNSLTQDIPTVMISTQTNKYIFNVPSSFQRYTKEHRIKLPVSAHYFFTKTCTGTITGLTGLLLTLFERGASCQSKLYLQNRLYGYLEQLRYKVGMKILPISYCSWEGQARLGWNNFKQLCQLSKKQDFAQIFNNFDQFLSHRNPNEVNNASTFYDRQAQIFSNEDFRIYPFDIVSKHQTITNYIIQPPIIPGGLKIQKLKQFGLAGKIIGELQKKRKVQHNGRTISIQEVSLQDEPSPHIVILHYNSIESIEKIIQNHRFRQYLQNKQKKTQCIIHIAQLPQIISSQQFKYFLNLWQGKVSHYVYNRQFKNSGDPVDQLHYMSTQNQICTQLSKQFQFCMPNLQKLHYQFVKNWIKSRTNIDKLFPMHKITAYRRCHQIVVVPRKKRGYLQIQGQKKQSSIQQVQFMHKQFQLQPEMAQKFKIFDPKVVFLGTGSMKPSKYRNVSGIFIQLNPQSSMMFDCGQGSHLQLADHYGHQKYEDILLSIQIIFITHIHSDHNLGMLDIISQRNAIMKKRKIDIQNNKLFLVLPANVVPWFNTFCQTIQNLGEGCQVVFIQSLRNQGFNFQGTMSKQSAFNRSCSMVEQSEKQASDQEDQLQIVKPEWEAVLKQYSYRQSAVLNAFSKLLESLGLTEFTPYPVIHCPQAHGIIVKHLSGVKISYSGDTRPCSEFAQAAIGSTLMIHEATHGDDLCNQAAQNFHSTVGQAIDIGMKAKSWKTALTHFSQRYKSTSQIVNPKLYKLNQQKMQYTDKHTIVCFDHLQIKLSQAHKLPYYTKIMSTAFPSQNKQ